MKRNLIPSGQLWKCNRGERLREGSAVESNCSKSLFFHLHESCFYHVTNHTMGLTPFGLLLSLHQYNHGQLKVTYFACHQFYYKLHFDGGVDNYLSGLDLRGATTYL